MKKPADKRTKDEAAVIADEIIAAVDALAQRTGHDPWEIAVHTKAAAWKEIDAAWFKQHPKRAYYVRTRLPDEYFNSEGEVPQPSPIDVVAVRQIRPGFRSRMPLQFTGDIGFVVGLRKLIKRGEHEEGVARGLFELTADMKESDAIHIDKVRELISRYQ